MRTTTTLPQQRRSSSLSGGAGSSASPSTAASFPSLSRSHSFRHHARHGASRSTGCCCSNNKGVVSVGRGRSTVAHLNRCSPPSFSSRRSTHSNSLLVARSLGGGGGGGNRQKSEERQRVVDSDVVEFGYSRKDVILLCSVPLVGGYATYYGLQKLFGLNPIQAGNYVQVIFVFILCVGWCGTYLFRVGTKNMTYTQQLKDYEEAVMEKRLEEMSESEIQEILDQSSKNNNNKE